VCSRRSEASTACMMWRRDSPLSFGPGPIGAHTFVARITAARFSRAAIQVPSTVSDSPPLLPGAHRPYTSAVSLKLPPAVRGPPPPPRLLVRRPPERVAPETERGDLHPRTTERAHQHACRSSWVIT